MQNTITIEMDKWSKFSDEITQAAERSGITPEEFYFYLKDFTFHFEKHMPKDIVRKAHEVWNWRKPANFQDTDRVYSFKKGHE